MVQAHDLNVNDTKAMVESDHSYRANATDASALEQISFTPEPGKTFQLMLDATLASELEVVADIAGNSQSPLSPDSVDSSKHSR